MRFSAFVLLGCLSGAVLSAQFPGAAIPAKEWKQLFNGNNLKGWTPKIRGSAPGENFAKTFRVENGFLSVRYDGYDEFRERFGHLFYAAPYSYYIIAAEYRFTGDQAKGGPGWATRNSGIMVHGQTAESMTVDQDFPISIEMQLLGGLGKGPRTTANLCTPGTNVVRDGKLFTPHCLNSKSKTYDGDQWVRVEVKVLGGERIEHWVEGEMVLAYDAPQMGGGNVSKAQPGLLVEGKILTEGTISLQSESHPIDFRRVEIVELIGCMDAKAKNFRKHYVKDDPKRCRY
jgi:Domain of Unknown Function (DUF1080)